MCPFSGAVQFLIIVVTLLLLTHSVIVHSLEVKFNPKNVTLHMYDTVVINYEITDDVTHSCQQWQSSNDHIAKIDENTAFIKDPIGSFNITGNFLGFAQVSCQNSNEKLDVTVIRKTRLIDTIFTSSVATLVSIIYINFGCALNWNELGQTLKRPIGPAIGFVSQFLLMPLLSFGLGRLLFPTSPAMQLGMFFTGVSPAGGASNIWTVVLDGNLDLSITMTTISTLAAFFMMPIWIFSLGRLIFAQGDMQVPYVQISTYAVALVIPLGVGYLLSRYCKRVAHFLVRMLKGFSALLLLFIVVFAVVANLYLFELFSWRIVVAGMGLPYLGYAAGYVVARAFRQPPGDCLAIAIETGIQNTGIAIFLLRFALPQPEADLTTVAPVAVATMTPVPLMLVWIYRKIRDRISSCRKQLDTKGSGRIDTCLMPGESVGRIET